MRSSEPVRPLSGRSNIAAQGPDASGAAPLLSSGAAASSPGGGPDPSAELLLRYLPQGRKHATSVSALSLATGLSPREVRAALEELVNVHRVPVVTLPTNPGVFIAETPDEVELGDAHLRAKAMALLRRRRSLRLCRERLAWSPTLFEVGP